MDSRLSKRDVIITTIAGEFLGTFGLRLSERSSSAYRVCLDVRVYAAPCKPQTQTQLWGLPGSVKGTCVHGTEGAEPQALIHSKFQRVHRTV